jgi:hypothetical protein
VSNIFLQGWFREEGRPRSKDTVHEKPVCLVRSDLVSRGAERLDVKLTGWRKIGSRCKSPHKKKCVLASAFQKGEREICWWIDAREHPPVPQIIHEGCLLYFIGDCLFNIRCGHSCEYGRNGSLFTQTRIQLAPFGDKLDKHTRKGDIFRRRTVSRLSYAFVVTLDNSG